MPVADFLSTMYYGRLIFLFNRRYDNRRLPQIAGRGELDFINHILYPPWASATGLRQELSLAALLSSTRKP